MDCILKMNLVYVMPSWLLSYRLFHAAGNLHSEKFIEILPSEIWDLVSDCESLLHIINWWLGDTYNMYGTGADETAAFVKGPPDPWEVEILNWNPFK